MQEVIRLAKSAGLFTANGINHAYLHLAPALKLALDRPAGDDVEKFIRYLESREHVWCDYFSNRPFQLESGRYQQYQQPNRQPNQQYPRA